MTAIPLSLSTNITTSDLALLTIYCHSAVLRCVVCYAHELSAVLPTGVLDFVIGDCAADLTQPTTNSAELQFASRRHDINMEHDDYSEGRLDITVGSPQKENEGTKDAYISYLVSTHVRQHH